MTCGKCNGHWCWICKEGFDNKNDTETHCIDTHGGLFFDCDAEYDEYIEDIDTITVINQDNDLRLDQPQNLIFLELPYHTLQLTRERLWHLIREIERIRYSMREREEQLRREIEIIKQLLIEKEEQLIIERELERIGQLIRDIERESARDNQLIRDIERESARDNQLIRDIERESARDIQLIRDIERESARDIQLIRDIERESARDNQLIREIEREIGIDEYDKNRLQYTYLQLVSCNTLIFCSFLTLLLIFNLCGFIENGVTHEVLFSMENWTVNSH
jgi:hypothetical protein